MKIVVALFALFASQVLCGDLNTDLNRLESDLSHLSAPAALKGGVDTASAQANRRSRRTIA
jgi:hypothetical protein